MRTRIDPYRPRMNECARDYQERMALEFSKLFAAEKIASQGVDELKDNLVEFLTNVEGNLEAVEQDR